MNDLGITVKVYSYRKPRKEEKTWTASKYSIFNIGAQAMKLGRRNVRAECDALVA
jgi:tRNA(Ile2) C34 agmatinyltransferase TiaS